MSSEPIESSVGFFCLELIVMNRIINDANLLKYVAKAEKLSTLAAVFRESSTLISLYLQGQINLAEK
jgi:hypothetical protein